MARQVLLQNSDRDELLVWWMVAVNEQLPTWWRFKNIRSFVRVIDRTGLAHIYRRKSCVFGTHIFMKVRL